MISEFAQVADHLGNASFGARAANVGVVSDLLGLSARRMLQALADGETEPARLAELADRRLRATPEQLCDALGACADLNPVYRKLVQMTLEELRLLEEQSAQLDEEMAHLLGEQARQLQMRFLQQRL